MPGDTGTFVGTLEEGCAGMGIALPSGAAEKFRLYDEMLRDENQRQNLTRDLDAPDYIQRLYLDSLTPLTTRIKGKRAVDVGTGAGFPGVPLAIARPDITFTLLDSMEKRCAFLRRAVEALGLNTEVARARAEDFGRMKERRGGYDLALCRAVAPLSVLLELAVPLLRAGGMLIAHKGPAVEDEYPGARRAAAMLGARLLDPVSAGVPGTGSRHVLAMALAVRSCPDKYPRRAGEPARSPLG
ncbi:MAG: 16S rRNA (guanine(527)-N(7))-methyltransferase RsmG [Oscillospiraceae bacterium]|nr:16S rRNA (guanine(527)-N(7))-methyltransferase RsmG [Oscillospiraceae bacterium]